MDTTTQSNLQYIYDRIKNILASKVELTLQYDDIISKLTSQRNDITSQLDLKAPLASPEFTGVPKAPTAAASTNTTQLATTAFVQTAIANLVNSAPETLDTLDELAAALGDDANFATTVTNALAGKLAANSADYLKSLSINGTTLTYTLGNNTTGTLTTQDTTYSEMSAQDAATGVGTTGLLISPKVLNDKIEEKIPTNISTFTNDSGYLTAVSWSDVSNKPSTFAPATHNQASDTIDLLTGYSKPNSTSALAATDTLNEALGKLEKALDGKQASGSYLTTTGTAADSDKLGGTVAADYALKTDLSTDAATVNGHTVAADVPSGAVFTDTTYNEATTSDAGLMSALDKSKLDDIDSAAISKLQQILTKETNQTASLSWAVGTIAQASGNNSSNTKRIRTVDRLKCSQYTRIQVASGYQYCVYVYSGASSGFLGSFDGTNTTTFSSTAVFLTNPVWLNFNNNYYIRIVLAQIAGGAMATTESENISIYGFN